MGQKEEIDNSLITKGDLNTPLSEINRKNTQKISKDMKGTNKAISHSDLTVVSRTLHSAPVQGTCFFEGVATKINHMLGHETSPVVHLKGWK